MNQSCGKAPRNILRSGSGCHIVIMSCKCPAFNSYLSIVKYLRYQGCEFHNLDLAMDNCGWLSKVNRTQDAPQERPMRDSSTEEEREACQRD